MGEQENRGSIGWPRVGLDPCRAHRGVGLGRGLARVPLEEDDPTRAVGGERRQGRRRFARRHGERAGSSGPRELRGLSERLE